MNTISAPEGNSVISQVLAAYALPGTVMDVARHGKGQEREIENSRCVCRRHLRGNFAALLPRKCLRIHLRPVPDLQLLLPAGREGAVRGWFTRLPYCSETSGEVPKL